MKWKWTNEQMILQLNAETTKVLTISISWGVPFRLVFYFYFLQWAFLNGPSQKILKIWKPPYIEVFIPNLEKHVPMLVHLYNFQEDICRPNHMWQNEVMLGTCWKPIKNLIGTQWKLMNKHSEQHKSNTPAIVPQRKLVVFAPYMLSKT